MKISDYLSRRLPCLQVIRPTGLLVVLLLGACATSGKGSGTDQDSQYQYAPQPATPDQPQPAAQPPQDGGEALQTALALLRDKRNDAAEEALLKLTQEQPQIAEAWLNLGLLYARSKRLAQAEQMLTQAAKTAPASPLILNELGIVQRKRGHHDAAEQAYMRALNLDKDYAPAHLNAGILYDLHLDRPDQALTHYQRYLDINPQETIVKLWIAQLKESAAQSSP